MEIEQPFCGNRLASFLRLNELRFKSYALFGEEEVSFAKEINPLLMRYLERGKFGITCRKLGNPLSMPISKAQLRRINIRQLDNAHNHAKR